MFWNNSIFLCRFSLAIRMQQHQSSPPEQNYFKRFLLSCPPHTPIISTSLFIAHPLHWYSNLWCSARNCTSEVIKVTKLKTKTYVQPLYRPILVERDSQRTLARNYVIGHHSLYKELFDRWSDTSLQHKKLLYFRRMNLSLSSLKYVRISISMYQCTETLFHEILLLKNSSKPVVKNNVFNYTMISRGSNK